MGMGDRFTKTIEEKAAAERLAKLTEAKKAHFEATAETAKFLAEHFEKAVRELTARLEEALKEGKRELKIAQADIEDRNSSLRAIFWRDEGREALIEWLTAEGFRAKKSLKSLGGRWVSEINAEAGGYNHNEYSSEITINW